MAKATKKKVVEEENWEYSFKTETLVSRVMSSMKEYAISRNEEIIPSAHDGLKEVQRRIIYAALQLRLLPSLGAKLEKVSRVGGDTMGKYHPHGNTSIDNAIVTLGQAHTLRYPLIEGQGDFGSQDTGRSAAPRYLECRVSKFAEEVYLADLIECPNCISYKRAYTDTGDEPVVLPAKLPMVLIHGTTSIGGGGYASQITPHTLDSVCKAVDAYIENMSISNELLADMLRLDYPSGGIVVNSNAVKKRYRQPNTNAKGKDVTKSVRIRSKVEYDEENCTAVVTELPYGVDVKQIMKKVQDLKEHNEAIDNMIGDVIDGSDKNGINIIIKGKEGIDIRNLMYKLFQSTPLESYKAIVFCLLKDGYPDDTYTIKRMIEEWFQFRLRTLIRKFTLLSCKYKENIVILEGKEICFNNLKRFTDLATSSKGRADLIEKLIKELKLNKLQAYKISGIPVYQLSKFDRNEVIVTKKKWEDRIKYVEQFTHGTLDKKGKVIKSGNDNITQYIREEVALLGEKYKKKPLTKLDNINLEIQSVHPDIDYVVTLKDGFIMKKDVPEVRVTKRGAKGVQTKMASNELVEQINNNDLMILFTNMGRYYRIFCYDLIPNVKQLLTTFMPLVPGEKVVSIIPVGKESNFEDDRVVITTTFGQVKSNYLETFQHSRRDATGAITLEDGEELFNAMKCTGKDKLIMATNSGLGLTYPVDEITIHKSRNSKGMKAIRDLKGSMVIGACIMSDDINDLLTKHNLKDEQLIQPSILLVKADGYGKRILLKDLKVKKRGDSLNILIKCDRDNELVVLKGIDTTETTIQLYSDEKVISMQVSEIDTLSRTSVGRKLMDISKDDSVRGALVL